MRGAKRLVALTAAFATLAGLASGCAQRGADTPDSFITSLGVEPQNPLIPSNTNEIGGGWVVDRLFAGLVALDADGNAHNEVAESIQTTDRRHYRIMLKPGWTFSDGEPVTAQSFAEAWNYGALSTNAQLQTIVYEPIEGYAELAANPPTATSMRGVQVIDDRTLQVDLVRPTIDFQVMLAWSPFYPLPKSAFKDIAAFGEHPIGNGPYQFAGPRAWQHNVKLDLVPNPAYHGVRPPKNKGLSLVYYSNPTAGYADLVANNLDFDYLLPNDVLGVYRRDLGGRTIQRPTAYSEKLGIPEYLPHFSGEEGKLRRRAIAKAIDRAQIAKVIFRGTVQPSTDFTASVLPGHSAAIPGVDGIAFDPEGAKALWARADAISKYDGVFTIGYNADASHQRWVEAMANYLRKNLGIRAEGKAYPTFKDFRSAIVDKTIGGAFRNGWQGDYPTMLQYLEPNFLSGSETNDVKYVNPRFDELLRQAEGAATLEESQVIANRAQELLFEDLPSLPLWDQVTIAGYSTRIVDPQSTWNATPDFENMVKR